MNEAIEREGEGNLEASGEFEDGDADEENAEHGNGGVALPVLGATVRATCHTPYLVPDIAAVPVICCSASHFCDLFENVTIETLNQL